MRTALVLAALVAQGPVAGAAGAGPAAGDAPVTFIPADSVAAGFARGAVLVNRPDYMIHASRRTTPGMVEVHEKDTDLIYMLEGEATFVTGGTLLDGKPTGPDEIRGTKLEGGETRRIVKGDVVVVPNGVCHWFKEVKGPVLYYVVKVR
jgi:uncharacterized cupin superfamily protein